MVLSGASGLALSPAQRALVEKGLAAHRARADKDAIQHAIESANKLRIEETKARCRAQQTGQTASDRDRRLIIRHVGEELARVAQREQAYPGKKHRRPGKEGDNDTQHRTSNGPTSSLKEPNNAQHERDDYDEDRYGPVHRPPRQRPPNLWVTIFEKEAADVRQEQDEAKRKRLADATLYRELLGKQEVAKDHKRREDRAAADAYAKLQADQTAQWKASEQEKLRRHKEQVAEESKRTQKELRDKHEQQMAVQRSKEQNELRVVARYMAQMEAEKKRQEADKVAHKAEMELVKQSNARQLELKREQQRREQDEELALQTAYERKLAQQELAREQELAAITAKQTQKVKMALLNVKSAEEKSREDEERAAKVQAQVREREARELVRREQHKKATAQRQVAALIQQKQERVDRRLVLQREEDVYAGECKRDFRAWQQQEMNKKLAVAQRDRAHQQLVRQQMAADAARRADEDRYGMNRPEMQLNAQLLAHAGLRSLPTDAHSR